MRIGQLLLFCTGEQFSRISASVVMEEANEAFECTKSHRGAGGPLEDLSELERVIFVMKGGKIVKAP